MISRKQIGDAYQCCHQVARRMIRAAGITHRNGLNLIELRKIITLNGYPPNKAYYDIAEMAMKTSASHAQQQKT